MTTPGREHEIPRPALRTGQHPDVRGYRFDQLHRQGVYRDEKRNARYRVLERRPVGSPPGITSDQVIRLTGKAAGCLSTPLRRIGSGTRRRGSSMSS